VQITAIDVLLPADQRMVSRALAANAGLRANFGSGFALDADHAPHITVLQRFVRTADLAEPSPSGRSTAESTVPGGTQLGVAVADLVVDHMTACGMTVHDLRAGPERKAVVDGVSVG
jgi:hypothetical protein